MLDNKQDISNQRLLIEPSGFIRELTREEINSKMQEYEIIGFRVVLRES